jgi:hypothetical protein
MSGYDEGAFAGFGGNDNIAISDTSFTQEFAGAYAEVGNDNYALNMGPENSFATAFDGNSNVAIDRRSVWLHGELRRPRLRV